MFLGREQNDPGRKTTCLKYRMHFGAQSPWKYVVAKVEVGKCWNLKTPSSKALGFCGAQNMGCVVGKLWT